MNVQTSPVSIIRLADGVRTTVEERVVREVPLTLRVNGQEFVTLFCTPPDLDRLAVGFLAAQGLLERAEELLALEVEEDRGLAQVEIRDPEGRLAESDRPASIGAGCGRGLLFDQHRLFLTAPKLTSPLTLPAARVPQLLEEFFGRTPARREAGSVQCAGLGGTDGMECIYTDVGQHNALDKVLGEALLQGWPGEEKVLGVTGRLTSEIVLRAARRRIPVLLSRSGPSDLAVRYARGLGLTLIGYVREEGFSLFAGPERIVNE